MDRLTNFAFEEEDQRIQFEETDQVAPGVTCDVYIFVDDESKDLGIIYVEPGCKTPLQRVLLGTRTVEGFISGKGKLTITKTDAELKVYRVGNTTKPFSIDVEIGYVIQWEAAPDSELVAYEICFPPYQKGRFENIV